MNKPFETPFKYLEENAPKIGINEEEIGKAIEFLIETVSLKWFEEKYIEREKDQTQFFYVNPLIIYSKSPIDTTLFELYSLAKHLRYFQSDKNYFKIIQMLKSDDIDEYYSAAYQLAMAFRISLSKGKNLELEPEAEKNIADLKFEVMGKKYVAEVSVLNSAKVMDYLEKLNYVIMDALQLKKHLGLRIVLKIKYTDACYTEKLPNLFAELHKDIKLILGKVTKPDINTPFTLVSKFYTLNVNPFKENEPPMPFIAENGQIVNFMTNWDAGFGVKAMRLKEGKTEVEIFEDINQELVNAEAKIVAKFPLEDSKKNTDRLIKKIQAEFSQLTPFHDMGKIVILEIGDWYFANKEEIEKKLKKLILEYQQLSSIFLTIHSKMRFAHQRQSYLIIDNPKNSYRLPQKFFSLLQSH